MLQGKTRRIPARIVTGGAHFKAGRTSLWRGWRYPREKRGAGADRSPTRRPAHRPLTRTEGRRRSGKTPANLSPATRARCGASPRAPRRVNAKTRARVRPLPASTRSALGQQPTELGDRKKADRCREEVPPGIAPRCRTCSSYRPLSPTPKRQYNPLSSDYINRMHYKIKKNSKQISSL